MTMCPERAGLADHVALDHAHGARRRNEPAPASSRLLTHAPAERRLPLARLLRGQERPHRLDRHARRGFRVVHDDLGHDRDDVAPHLPPPQLVEEALLEDVAEAPLGHRDERVDGHRRHRLGQSTDLGPVPVREDEVVLLLHQRHERSCDARRVGALLLDRAALPGLDERVASQSDENDRFSGGLRHARRRLYTHPEDN
jgi:hypothetical protein